MSSRRQTQSYLRNLFARRGVAPQHRYGQNFLIDLNIHELIVNAAEVGPDDVVLEIGPGAGALTALMAERGAAVVAVEIDPAMARLTTEAVEGRLNVRVLNVDALASKHTMNPEVLDNVRAGLAVSPEKRLKLVANLPYNVATPILSNLLVHPEFCPTLLVVTIQLELAQRICAGPEEEEYGALSVLMQALADVSIVRTLAPTVFWPRPKVESAVISIRPDASKRALVHNLAWFHQTIRQLFLHRRKNLRRVLYSLWRDRWTKLEVDTFLEGLGLTGLVRAEAMNVEELLTLTQQLGERFNVNNEGALPESPAEASEDEEEASDEEQEPDDDVEELDPEDQSSEVL
ncbi:16S rRNA (adenine(1518)-N(6)/adenine(1519)-N(6))-dimethyltransferase RsmA [Singulisphaera acidiphila]|uniref:Ribosomal RNA small subunit methyltransferase A n=1 Tax=Singulisphaera acidiphila (strain ATCC BAA-1392 / DSM 18658 / VKM B-2454 / MOB10) TaxID=886293 RepID=L0DRE2_SINAD|nr:16S rRNA (adenine(1518)-N(6)/adenine(1519)-N(6))-dimethyltransferase RsmA [Singulisphaera acidiphila]AGA31593.1 dimethyladenosine transferase [Singulisphaera acidiphila DSM 18658]